MTPSLPLLAAAPLVAGLVGAALLGATPTQHLEQHLEQPRPAAATRVATRPEVVEHVAARSDRAQRRVLAYWTPSRMASALPIDLIDSVTAKVKKNGLLGGISTGTDLSAAPRLVGADGRVDLPRKILAPRKILTPGKKTTPRPHRALAHQSAKAVTSTSGSLWGAGGLVSRTTGRVFLTLKGVDFVCSASTVKSANHDLVLTAGHCVKDGTGAWADNWTFVPSYRAGGGRPYGSYTARRMFVAGPWSHSGDDSADVGMVALNQSDGRHAIDAVGYQNILFDRPRGGRLYGFGFPADAPYDGESLIYCAGSVRDDPYGQTRDQGLPCDMTAGSSGGPWLTDFDTRSGRGSIVSLSSFKYSDNHHVMYGPYFGESAKALFRLAERA